jgi:hypothetical protein
MPSTSAKQEKFMRAVANSPKFAKKVGVPQSVGKEFEMKDEGKMMKKEGRGMAKADMQKAALKKHASMPASKAHAGLKKGGMAKLTKAEMPSKMGAVKTAKPSMGSASKRADGVASKGKTKGMMPKMMQKGGSCK